MRAAIIDRAALDRLLAERGDAGRRGRPAGQRASRPFEIGPSGVTVTTRGGPSVLASACVLAAGANYRFHRALGLGGPTCFCKVRNSTRRFRPGPRLKCSSAATSRRPGSPGSCRSCATASRRARVGLMSRITRAGSFLRRSCGPLSARTGWSPCPAPEPRLKILPLGPVDQTYADRVVAIGDAAGLVKPTTGGGIYYGMLSGQFAADTLGECLLRDRLTGPDLKKYELRWRQQLGAEIRMGIAFRRVAETLTDESIDAFIELGRANGVVPLLQRTASFNWHRKAAMALLGHASFRRIVLGPGAKVGRT